MKGSFCAFLDASVIYPASLRDLLMRLTFGGSLPGALVKVSARIMDQSRLGDSADLTAEKLHRVRDAMDRHAQDAIVTGADVIVTRNLKDFPDEVLYNFEIDAQHPDEFLRHIINLAPSPSSMPRERNKALW